MKVLNINNNTCGIYCLLNTNNSKKYIGLSRNVLKRIQDHKKCLDKGNHYNTHLQDSYSKNPFIAFLVQECLPEELKNFEMLVS